VLDEILDESAASSRHRRNPRGVKRKMSNFPLRRGYKRSPLRTSPQPLGSLSEEYWG
jgi:hypothetical protein